MKVTNVLRAVSCCGVVLLTSAARPCGADLASVVRDLDVQVLPAEKADAHAGMLAADIERRRLEAIARENAAWSKVATRADWEAFLRPRIAALRASLNLPEPEKWRSRSPRAAVHVPGEIRGAGYCIENVVLPGRPGLPITANLYRPSGDTPASGQRPGIVIVHSHHAPKSQSELQEMGMQWAREGCVVLVVELLGHGERRQHPFVSSADYPEPFRLGRQDYHFRYNVGQQLHLVGESLMGWFVWDLMRAVDLLSNRSDVDQDRLIMIGGVAGGGDPAAVAAALDPRIDAVIPFNFGGPQPDYPIPVDAEREFYFFGEPYWETTRNLRLGGRDGFAHWVIAAAGAPRPLVYAYEFDWPKENDPVWPRLQKVYRLYDAEDHLATAHGRGELKGRPPESTHCCNVGPIHREQFYPHLQRWFEMTPPKRFEQRYDPAELACLTAPLPGGGRPRPVHQVATELARERLARARKERGELSPDALQDSMRRVWARLLGDVAIPRVPQARVVSTQKVSGVLVERVVLTVEPGIQVPLVLLIATNRWKEPSREDPPRPVVILHSRRGKAAWVKSRAKEIAGLLEGGAAVCLPDLRGTGETSPGEGLGRQSINTTLACRDAVLGQTLLAGRLRDLRSVLAYLETRPDCKGPLAVWGASLAPINPADRPAAVPCLVDNPNTCSEPTPGLLSLLVALFDQEVKAVAGDGTFASFFSLLESPFLYAPHDAVVPGVLADSDVSDLLGALAPRPARLERFVNGLNRPVASPDAARALDIAVRRYRAQGGTTHLCLPAADPGSTDEELTTEIWLLGALKR